MKYHVKHPDPNAIPFEYCHCGCGQKTALARQKHPERNMVIGQPMQFIHGHSSRHRSIPIPERFWKHVSIGAPDECWPWMTYTYLGYGIFSVTHNQRAQAHRMAYELIYGPIPDGMLICHRCNNRPCCNPAHLYVGTDAENLRDSIIAGTAYKLPALQGSANPRSKLTEGAVQEIRRLYATGNYHVRDLAPLFGVHFSTIARVCRSEGWKHVA